MESAFWTGRHSLECVTPAAFVGGVGNNTVLPIHGDVHVQAGTPLFALQEMGGWSSAEMVRRYAHLAADHLAPFAEKLCRPLGFVERAVPESLGTIWSQSAK